MRFRAASFAPLLVAAVALAEPSAKAPAKKVLPFIENDYDRALAEAKAKKLPLFIEAWAPW